MLEILRERKAALEAQGKKGFTLMEMLIVIAIIAILIAIAIPIFTAQMENSREATDKANVRSAYSELVSDYLTTGKTGPVIVNATQTQPKWQSENNKETIWIGTSVKSATGSVTGEVSVSYVLSGKAYALTFNSRTGSVTCTESNRI